MREINEYREFRRVQNPSCAPSEQFYVRGDSEAICLPNGSLRYFETELFPDPSR